MFYDGDIFKFFGALIVWIISIIYSVLIFKKILKYKDIYDSKGGIQDSIFTKMGSILSFVGVLFLLTMVSLITKISYY